MNSYFPHMFKMKVVALLVSLQFWKRFPKDYKWVFLDFQQLQLHDNSCLTKLWNTMDHDSVPQNMPHFIEAEIRSMFESIHLRV
jgi:hypothetical protein